MLAGSYGHSTGTCAGAIAKCRITPYRLMYRSWDIVAYLSECCICAREDAVMSSDFSVGSVYFLLYFSAYEPMTGRGGEGLNFFIQKERWYVRIVQIFYHI